MAEYKRYMRLFVLFDLPTNTKKERKYAARFRKDLLNDGFTMLQYSVYCRICKGQESVDLHIQYVAQVVPPKGSVRLLSITDMQYARMRLLVGQKKLQENIHQQLLLF